MCQRHRLDEQAKKKKLLHHYTTNFEFKAIFKAFPLESLSNFPLMTCERPSIPTHSISKCGHQVISFQHSVAGHLQHTR